MHQISIWRSALKDKNSSKKTRTRLNILRCAQKTFLDKGYHNTEMGDIARIAKIDKRTIYRYFDSKEALAFSVWKKVIADVMDVGLNAEGNSGYEKVEFLLNSYLEKFNDNQNIVRFLGQFDHIFTNEYPNVDEADEFESYIKNRDNEMLEYLEEGIEDKSIKNDIDVNLVAATISNIMMSLSQRVVIRGEHLKKEQGYSFELMKQATSLILMAIKEN